MHRFGWASRISILNGDPGWHQPQTTGETEHPRPVLNARRSHRSGGGRFRVSRSGNSWKCHFWSRTHRHFPYPWYHKSVPPYTSPVPPAMAAMRFSPACLQGAEAWKQPSARSNEQ